MLKRMIGWAVGWGAMLALLGLLCTGSAWAQANIQGGGAQPEATEETPVPQDIVPPALGPSMSGYPVTGPLMGGNSADSHGMHPPSHASSHGHGSGYFSGESTHNFPGRYPGQQFGPSALQMRPDVFASRGVMGPDMIHSLYGAGDGLSAVELLGPEILPKFNELPKEIQDRLRQLHVSMMQVLLQQRAALQAQLLGLRESLHGFPVDAEKAGKQFQGMQDARNAMFQLMLNGMAQQQRLLGQEDWERLHGLHVPEPTLVPTKE